MCNCFLSCMVKRIHFSAQLVHVHRQISAYIQKFACVHELAYPWICEVSISWKWKHICHWVTCFLYSFSTSRRASTLFSILWKATHFCLLIKTCTRIQISIIATMDRTSVKDCGRCMWVVVERRLSILGVDTHKSKWCKPVKTCIK